MLWLVLLLLGPVAFIAYLVHKHNIIRQVWLSGNLPGPPAYPVIGNGLLFLNKTAVENFNVIYKLMQDYGDVVRVWIGPDLNIFMGNPKDIEVLLSNTKNISKSSEYKYVKPWLNDGLLLTEGKKWSQRRKILTPAFHFKILEQFVEVFDRQSIVMMDTLSRLRADEKVEFYPLATLYALDVICESAMGTTINAQKNDDSDYVRAVKEMSHVLHLRMFDFLLRIDAIFMFSRLSQEMNGALTVLHNFTDKVIRERRQELLDGNEPSIKQLAGDDDIGTKPKMAFLDILLQASIDDKPLTDLEIREEVDTFMFAGHDTTTSGITFCLYNIAKYPEVQQKCFEDIRRVIGDQKDTPITLQDLNNLHYLDLVIKETLRLFPSVPLIGRQIFEETTINGRTYPAGCNFVVNIFSMGRSADHFDDPEQFRPERFDAELTKEKYNTFAYIPFSAGSRNCIGQKFAMLEMKTVLSKILRYHAIELAAESYVEPQMTAELVLVPASRIKFHLKQRVY